MRRLLEEPAVLHENVVDFVWEILQEQLGPQYVMWSCVVNALDLGQSTSRPRRFTWLLSRKFLLTLSRPMPQPWDRKFLAQFYRTLRNLDWRALFTLGSDDEILEEAKMGSQQKVSSRESR